MPRPKVFDSERFRAARQSLDDYVNEKDERRQRQRRAPYDVSLLKHPEIKETLLKGFGGVCAYCEVDMRGFGFFDIEHHRPKISAADSSGRTEHLYYVWLAYDWDNLLPVCRTCNNAKRNKFYVEGPRGSIGASVAKLREQETSRLLDPCHSDIAKHLAFTPSGLARGKSVVGAATIEILALNRDQLIQQRRRQFEVVAAMLLDGPMPTSAATGFKGGESSYVFADSSGEQLPHAGATTLAFLEVANRLLIGKSDLRSFLDDWRSEPSASRRDFLSVFGGASSPTKPRHVRTELRKPSKARHSHIIRIAETPTAELPICSIVIRNFKALAEIDLSLATLAENPDLAPCLLLLGENATGKSSVLEATALALLGTGETQALDRLVAAEGIWPREFAHRPDPADWDVVSKAPLSVEVRFTGSEHNARLEASAGQANFGGTEFPTKIVLGYGPRRYFPQQSNRRFRAPAHRVRSLFDPMATIVNPLRWLRDLHGRDRAQFDAAVRALRIVLMLDDDALIEVEGDEILIDTPHGQTPLVKMSVGYKSVIAMAIDIIRELFLHYDNLENAHAVVLVDEIETHLHPRWKMRIVGLLRQAFPRVQFILTTHDPLCLRGMNQGEVFVLQRNAGDNGIETLTELPNVQGMRAEQILTSEFFGLGSTDPETDAKIERYQYLTGKAERSGGEDEERARLVDEIEGQMMVGTTIAQQAEAEAARRANLDAQIPQVKVKDGDRKRMIEEALAKLLAE